MAFGNGDQLLCERFLRLRQENSVERDEELILAPGLQQGERGVIHVNNLHQRDGLADEIRVSGEVRAKVGDPLCLQVIDSGLDRGKVLFPDGHPGRLKDVPVSPFARPQVRLGSLLLGHIVVGLQDGSGPPQLVPLQ